MKPKINLYYNDIPEELIIDGDVAIDTETMGLNYFRDRLCLLQFSFGDNRAHLVKFDGHSYDAPNLRALLSNSNSTKIFHFARFDLAVIEYYLGVRIDNIFCTKIASRLARTYTDQHSLKELCREILEINLSKQQQTSFWGAKELSEEQKIYAANDVLYLHQIRNRLATMLVEANRQELASGCFKFLQARVRLDLGGWNEDIFAH